MGVQVTTIIKVGKGRLRLESKSPNLHKLINLSEPDVIGLKAKEHHKFKPRIAIKLVLSELSPE